MKRSVTLVARKLAEPCALERLKNAINRELIAKVEAIDSPQRGVLDSPEIPVYGQ